jgi:hypothetical protein
MYTANNEKGDLLMEKQQVFFCFCEQKKETFYVSLTHTSSCHNAVWCAPLFKKAPCAPAFCSVTQRDYVCSAYAGNPVREAVAVCGLGQSASTTVRNVSRVDLYSYNSQYSSTPRLYFFPPTAKNMQSQPNERPPSHNFATFGDL